MQINNLPCFWRSLPTECYGGYKHLLLHFGKRSHALTKTRTCVSESELYNYLNWWRPAVCLWMKESNPPCRRIPKHNMHYSSSLPYLLSCYRKQNGGISEAQTLSGNPIQTSAIVSTTILEMHSIEVRRSTIYTPIMGSKSALVWKSMKNQILDLRTTTINGQIPRCSIDTKLDWKISNLFAHIEPRTSTLI